MKKLLGIILLAVFTLSCSIAELQAPISGLDGIDGVDGIDGINATVETQKIKAGENEDYPYGGYLVTFTSASGTETIFISNGAPGTDGINGIDGVDGKDGVSAIAYTVEAEGGYWLYIGVGDDVARIFISNGTDGADGINGINGINGEDGSSVTVRTEKTEDGYWLHLTDSEGTHSIFIENGTDGTNGLDGEDGTNGSNGTNGQDGFSSSISIYDVEVGSEECEFGGYKIVVSSTNPVVADQVEYLCNCNCEEKPDDCEIPKVTICHVECNYAKSKSVVPCTYVTMTLPYSEALQHLSDHPYDKLGPCKED